MSAQEAHEASVECMVNLVGDVRCDPEMQIWLDANVPVRQPDVQAQRVRLIQTMLPAHTHIGQVVHKPPRPAAAEEPDIVDEDVLTIE
jgi:hypothetical protein